MIHYYYEDHETKKRVDVEEPVFDFMKKLIIHIPDAQFKMIRYYGIYATCHHKHREVVKKKQSLDNPTRISKISYRQDLIDTFDTAPLLCDCGHYMEYIDYWVPPNRRNEGGDFNDTT